MMQDISIDRLTIMRQLQVLQSITQGYLRVHDAGLQQLLSNACTASSEAATSSDGSNACMEEFSGLLSEARIPIAEFKREFSSAASEQALQNLAVHAHRALAGEVEFKIFDNGFLKDLHLEG